MPFPLIALLGALVLPIGAFAASAPDGAWPAALEGDWVSDGKSLASARKGLRKGARPLRRQSGERGRRGKKRGKKEDESYLENVLPGDFITISRGLEYAAIDHGDGRVRTLFLDGRGSTVDSTNQLAYFAGWEGSSLVVETTDNRNTRIIETYSLTGDGELEIHYELRNPTLRKPIKLRVLFRPAASD